MRNKFKKEYFSKKWISTLPECKNGYLKVQWIKLIINASLFPRSLRDILGEFDSLIGETNHHLFKPVNSFGYELNKDFDWEWYNGN